MDRELQCRLRWNKKKPIRLAHSTINLTFCNYLILQNAICSQCAIHKEIVFGVKYINGTLLFVQGLLKIVLESLPPNGIDSDSIDIDVMSSTR